MIMNRLGSKNDERDRELFTLASILKDVIISKYSAEPIWEKRLKDLDNILQHIVERRYGQPMDYKP